MAQEEVSHCVSMGAHRKGQLLVATVDWSVVEAWVSGSIYRPVTGWQAPRRREKISCLVHTCLSSNVEVHPLSHNCVMDNRECDASSGKR